MPSLAGPRLLLPLALLGIGCSTATSPTALDPDDLLSRYAQDGVADDAFCLLVEVVCGDPQFTQSEQCATLDQICSPSIPAADGGSPTGVPPADDAAPGAVAPGPQAPETGFTASASSSQPGAGAEKAFDGDTATTWENLSATAPGTGNCWLRADFGVGVQKALVRYDLYVRDNAPTFGGPAHFPKSWVFQGGDCATWNDLDTRAGQTLAADAWASFTFSSSSAHRCYRILVTASQGDTQWVNINEMRLYSTGTSSDAGGSPDPCSGVTCSGHGSCKVSGGAAQCVCDPGYHESGLTCAPDPAPTTCVGVIGLCSGGSTSGFGSGNVYTVSGGSICSAAKQLKPGDTLYVRKGTYTETLTDSCFTANGTASDRIYISGYPGETAVMDGKNDNGRRNAMSFKTRKFITIRNLEIRDYTGVSIWNDPGCESMVYENLYIHDIGKQTTYQWPCGLEFKGGKNSILRQSRLDNIGTDSLDHGIYLSYQSTGARINNNHFSKMSGAAVHAWHDVAAIGTLVYNNIITGSQHEAAIVFGDGSHDIKIYNNTLVENAGGGIRIFDYGETSKSPAHDVVIRNNILYKGGLQVMSGCKNVTQSNNTTANPLFVNAAAGDYRLQPASPAVDAGAAVPEVKTDIAGVTRPQGSAHDIGAHER